MKITKFDKKKAKLEIEGTTLAKVKLYLHGALFIFILKFKFGEAVFCRLYRKLIDEDGLHPKEAKRRIDYFIFVNTCVYGRIYELDF
jgi:hypothetical protein